MQPADLPFGDRLAERVERRQSQIVLGLDPDPGKLWPEAAAAADGAGDRAEPAARAAAAVAAHCRAVIAAAGPACVAIKPQLACFERLGAPGREALGAACDAAHEAGLLVLADGKRGDIDVSAHAYAQSLVGATTTPFGDVEGLGADAITASPFMGTDTVSSLLAVARERGAGVFVLVRTSNLGASDVMDAELTGGQPVWSHVARLVAQLGDPGVGTASGLADVGAVVGATAPEHIARMRQLMPRTPFLLPGIGAQGGRVEDVAPAFAPGRAGGLVTASRSIVNAHAETGSAPATASRAEAERLRETAWGLRP